MGVLLDVDGPGRSTPATMNIAINGRARVVEKGTICRLVSRLLATTKSCSKSISVTFVERSDMVQMNWKYRGKNRATDVLAFPGSDDFDHLGDLVICPHVVLRKSRFQQAAAGRQCQRLIIHGFAHLLGFDHETVSGHRAMQTKEASLWQSVCRFRPTS